MVVGFIWLPVFGLILSQHLCLVTEANPSPQRRPTPSPRAVVMVPTQSSRYYGEHHHHSGEHGQWGYSNSYYNNNNHNNNNNNNNNSSSSYWYTPGNGGTATMPSGLDQAWLNQMFGGMSGGNSQNQKPATTGANSLLTSKCGLNSQSSRDQFIPSPLDRIVGGVQAQKYEVPWQARVLAPVSGGTAICGGSLINDHVVLTAAHCVNEVFTISSIRVVLGDYSVRNYDSGDEKSFYASRVLVHPQYDTSSNSNDFALIFLSGTTTFNKAIVPVCLPKNSNNDYNGATSLISGWGRLQESAGNLPDTLQKASSLVIANSNCNQIYNGQAGLSITSSMICAYKGGTDTCQGDSGGPMTTLENGRFTLIGVTSFGIGCARQFPGVYSRVTSALNWITSNAGGYGTSS